MWWHTLVRKCHQIFYFQKYYLLDENDIILHKQHHANQNEFNVFPEHCILHSYLQFFTSKTLKLGYFLKKHNQVTNNRLRQRENIFENLRNALYDFKFTKSELNNKVFSRNPIFYKTTNLFTHIVKNNFFCATQ